MRRAAALTLLVLVGLVAAGYFYIARPTRLAAVTGELLENLSGAQVEIASAEFQFDGTIRLSDVTLSVPGEAADFGRLMHVDYIVIKHNMVSLFKASFHAESMTFVNPVLYLTENTATQQFNYNVLQRTRKDEDDELDLPDALPAVFLRGGVIQTARFDNGVYLPEEPIRINGTLTQHPARWDEYFFALRQDQAGAQPGPAITGGFNLRHLTVNAKLEQFTLDPQHRNLLPHELRQWWDRFQPQGSLPEVSFSYDDPEAGEGFRAHISVEGVNLTLPYGEAPTSMTNVSGTFAIHNQSVETSLAGYFEDVHYQIDGRIDGFSRDAPFVLTVKTPAFHLPAEPRYLLALPQFVQRQFAKLSPTGTFDADVTIRRDSTGGDIEYNGTVVLKDGTLVYAKFPYPLHAVEGHVRFDNKEIEIEQLNGRGETGALVTITGVITPPGKDAAVGLTIMARNMPIDQVLYDAMPSYAVKVIEAFGDKAAHLRLIDEGLMQTRAQYDDRAARLDAWLAQRDQLADEDAPDAQMLGELDRQIEQMRFEMTQPVFDLGGMTSVTADVKRPYGPDRKYVITTTIDMTGLNMIFRHWPYPMRLTGGELVVQPDLVEVHDITATGLRGGEGKLAGQVLLDPQNRSDYDPQLTLVAERLPIDELLLASVPDAYRNWLRQQQITGSIDRAGGRIYRGEEGRIDFQIATHVADVTARPYGGELRFDDVQGTLTFERKRLLLESIEATRDDARVKVDGQVSWFGDGALLDIDAAVSDMPLDAALLNILPPASPARTRLARLFDEYQLEGLFDADVHYRGLVGSDAPEDEHDTGYDVAARPSRLALVLRGAAIELTDITGAMRIRPNRIDLDQWAASHGNGRFQGSGTVGFDAASDINLRFSASSDELDATTRAVLPDAVLRTIDSLALEGGYAIDDAHLLYTPEAEAGPVLTFTGPVRMRDAAAVAGVTITEFDGSMALHVVQDQAQAMPRVEIDLAADSLRAAGRAIENATLRIDNAASRQRLDIHSLYGELYGGVITGRGEVALGKANRYRMSVAAEDARFTHVADPQDTDRNAAQATGVLFARLDIEGMTGDPDSKRGRGAMEVRNARMYELPFALALLQIANLTLPTSSAFDRATTRFLVDGDLVTLESIRFEAPSVQIVGAGTMAYSTQQVDLTMFSRGTGGDFGAVSDLANVFKDELMNIHITGTLSDPRTQVQSFRGVTDAWQRIFGPTPKRP